jgi:hypothetical protein
MGICCELVEERVQAMASSPPASEVALACRSDTALAILQLFDLLTVAGVDSGTGHFLTTVAEELVVAILQGSRGLERTALVVDLGLEVIIQKGVRVEGGITVGGGVAGKGRVLRHRRWRCWRRGLHGQLRADAAEAPDGGGDVAGPEMAHQSLEGLHPPVEEARGTSPAKAHTEVDHDIASPPIREEGGKPGVEEELAEGVLDVHLGQHDVGSGVPKAELKDAEEKPLEDVTDVARGDGRGVGEGVKGPVGGTIRHAACEGQVMHDAVLALAKDVTQGGGPEDGD